MMSLDRLMITVIISVGLLVAGGFGVHHYGAEQYEAGLTAAVAAGKEQRDREADANRKTESALRAQLRTKDADALELERTYEISLDVAQRRVRTRTDSLRCPASSVSATAAPGDRPASGGPDPDPAGPAIVPETAAEILGDAADIAGLVRRYDRVVERFDHCRALNAK